MAVESIVPVGAHPCFPDPYGEGLYRGAIVEWPKDQVTTLENTNADLI